MSAPWWTFDEAPAPAKELEWPPAFEDSNWIQLAGRSLPYRRRASPRARSLRIVVDPREGVVVRGTTLPGVDDSEALLRASRRWLSRALDRQGAMRAGPGLRLVEGKPLLWRGDPWIWRAQIGTWQAQEDREERLLTLSAPGPSLDTLTQSLERGGRTLARERVQRHLGPLTQRAGQEFSRLRIGDMRTRWASCSPRGTLSVTWRVMALGDELLDYLLLHELAHRVHANHGPQFWDLLERWSPNGRALDQDLGCIWVW